MKVSCRARSLPNDRQACHAFSADNADLDATVTGTIGDHRSKTMLHEVDLIDPLVAALKLFADRQVDGFEVGFEQSKVRT
jgi:hypothetical protein